MIADIRSQQRELRINVGIARINPDDQHDNLNHHDHGSNLMKRTLSAVEARKRLGEILEGVYYRGDEVTIERAGKPMAVVVPAHVYESIKASRERVFRFMEENWEKTKDIPPEELEALIDEAVQAARRPGE
jgi:prevent-host-death family protein